MVPSLPSTIRLFVIGGGGDIVQFANKFGFNSLFFNQSLKTINHYSAIQIKWMTLRSGMALLRPKNRIIVSKLKKSQSFSSEAQQGVLSGSRWQDRLFQIVL